MKVQTYILFILVALFLNSCRQEKRDFIDISKVKAIEILKNARLEESTIYLPKELSGDQIESFVNKFNKTTDLELRKFLPSYQILVQFNDKSTRIFLTSSRFIKEDDDKHYTDNCLDFGDIDSDYFDKLYRDSFDK